MQAEPSPAPEVEYSQATIDSMTHSQRVKWKETGELPAKPATSQATETPESAPASEAGKKTEQEPSPGPRTLSPAEKRIKELHTQTKVEKARADKAEARLAELERTRTAEPAKPTPEVKTESKPAVPPEPTPEDLNADGTAKFKDWAEYTKALA